jgi:hypothetical protein
MATHDEKKPDDGSTRRRERLAAELRRNLQLRKAQGRARRAGEPDLGVGLPAAQAGSDRPEEPAEDGKSC